MTVLSSKRAYWHFQISRREHICRLAEHKDKSLPLLWSEANQVPLIPRPPPIWTVDTIFSWYFCVSVVHIQIQQTWQGNLLPDPQTPTFHPTFTPATPFDSPIWWLSRQTSLSRLATEAYLPKFYQRLTPSRGNQVILSTQSSSASSSLCSSSSSYEDQVKEVVTGGSRSSYRHCSPALRRSLRSCRKSVLERPRKSDASQGDKNIFFFLPS